MARPARVAFAALALALVFAPRAVTTTGHDGARVLTAAVLAPTTGDSDAVTPAREQHTVPVLALLPLLVTALAIAAQPRAAAARSRSPHRPRDPTAHRPHRRGPPSPV